MIGKAPFALFNPFQRERSEVEFDAMRRQTRFWLRFYGRGLFYGFCAVGVALTVAAIYTAHTLPG